MDVSCDAAWDIVEWAREGGGWRMAWGGAVSGIFERVVAVHVAPHAVVAAAAAAAGKAASSHAPPHCVPSLSTARLSHITDDLIFLIRFVDSLTDMTRLGMCSEAFSGYYSLDRREVHGSKTKKKSSAAATTAGSACPCCG